MAGVSGTGRVTPTQPSASFPKVSVEIAARHTIEPFHQGELDALCSVYSAINAIRLALYGVAPLTKARAKELFACGTFHLERKGGLAETLASGTSTRRWHAIVRRLARHTSSSTMAVELEQPHLGPKPNVTEIFAWIEASIADGKPVLMRLAEGIDHFTVVVGVTANRLQLFDSCGHRFIKRKSCGTSGSYYRIPSKALLRIAVSRR